MHTTRKRKFNFFVIILKQKKDIKTAPVRTSNLGTLWSIEFFPANAHEKNLSEKSKTKLNTTGLWSKGQKKNSY